ncbi:MAG TPA: alpha/beta-type small acid-soluble spore protein [Clostridia bacterium]
MANNKKKLVPEATDALDKLKYEVASEEGVPLKDGYNGDLTAKEAGKVGGNMVKKMVKYAEKHMKDSK